MYPISFNKQSSINISHRNRTQFPSSQFTPFLQSKEMALSDELEGMIISHQRFMGNFLKFQNYL